MAQYTAIFTKPYEDGYENLPSQNTPITAETLNDKDDAIVNIETYLEENDIPSDASDLSYSNASSTLIANTVQSAIDELSKNKANADNLAYVNVAEGLVVPDLAYKTGGYAVGEHFMHKGKFCTAIADIAEGASLTLNTNYIEGTISDYLEVKEYTATSLQTWLTFATDDNRVKRSGNVVEFNLRFTITGMGTLSATADVIQLPFKHSNAIPCMFNIYVNDSANGYPLSNVVPYIGSNGYRLRLLKGSSLADGSYYLTGSYLTKDSI